MFKLGHLKNSYDGKKDTLKLSIGTAKIILTSLIDIGKFYVCLLLSHLSAYLWKIYES